MENIAASSLGALAAGGTVEGIKSALKQFRGLPHRLEIVDIKNGVTFFDDSKATNVDAVKKAIETFDVPVVIIMGGRDKGGDVQSLKSCLSQRAKKLIVLGEASDIISAIFTGVVRGFSFCATEALPLLNEIFTMVPLSPTANKVFSSAKHTSWKRCSLLS